MSMTTPLLKATDGLFSGSNSVEFHTLAHVTPHPVGRSYFGNFSFLGGRYRDEREILSTYSVADHNIVDHWDEAWVIDPNKPELVIDSLNVLNRRLRQYDDIKETVRLFKFKMDYSVTEVNTKEDEYMELRKWRALGKLSKEEIQMLGLEEQLVYLKLKYAKDSDDNGSLL